MRSDVRALLRPLVRTVGLLLAVAVGVIACLMVLAVTSGASATRKPYRARMSAPVKISRRRPSRKGPRAPAAGVRKPPGEKPRLCEGRRVWVTYGYASLTFSTSPSQIQMSIPSDISPEGLRAAAAQGNLRAVAILKNEDDSLGLLDGRVDAAGRS
jgi:hypothetical protein